MSTNLGGALYLGGGAGSTLTLNGDVTLDGATLDIDMASATQIDYIAVSGSVSYTTGTGTLNLGNVVSGANNLTFMTATSGLDAAKYTLANITVGGMAVTPDSRMGKGITVKGGMTALSGRTSDTDSFASTIGVRASVQLGERVTVNGKLGWQHAFGDRVPTSDVAFAGGERFRIEGAPMARDAVLLGLGLDAKLSDWATVSVGYQGSLGMARKATAAPPW